MRKLIKKVKLFFDRVVKSLTKFSYYKEISKAKFSFSLKYLFFLFYVISLIGSIIFAASISVLVLPKVPGFVATFESKAVSLYPKGLIVTIKDGQVLSNVKEPYSVDTLNSLGVSKGYDHFLTIDTKAVPSDIKKESTLVLITKDSFVTIDSNNSYKVYQIDPKTNLKIDQSSYNKLISQISPYLKYIEPALIVLVVLSLLVGPILAASFSLIGQLIYLLIFTIIFFIIVKLMKKDLSFKKLYQLCMHGSTLPILLSFVVSSVGVQMPFMLGSAILFVFMILVVNQF